MKDVNIKVDYNQKRICNEVKGNGNFMKLYENAIIEAVNGEHELNARTFTIWQALCMTYFKEEEAAITKNLALSTQFIADKFGFNKRVVQRAIEELIEKGWLVNLRDELWALVVPGTAEVCTSSTASEEDDEVVCTSSTQGYVQEVHRGMYRKYTQSIIKEEEEVDSIYDLDAAEEIEEELEVVEVQPAATTIEDAASEAATQQAGNALEHLIAADKTEKRCFQIGKFAPWFGSSIVDGKAAAKLELTVRELGEHVRKNYENYGCGSLINLEQVYNKTWELWSEAKQWRVASRM